MSHQPESFRNIYVTAKRARSNIDEETRLIENRIRMIKFEEERAIKRIQETREKIDEVYKSRTRYIENKHSKNIQKEKVDKNLTDLQETIRSNRIFHEEKIGYTQQELLNIKKNQGKRVRGWKEYIKRNIQQQNIEKKRYNRKLKEAVQLSSEQGKARLKLLQDIKAQKAKYLYNKNIEEENLRRSAIEQEMALLGKEEQMLMERITNVHEIQRQTVEELEKIYN